MIMINVHARAHGGTRGHICAETYAGHPRQLNRPVAIAAVYAAALHDLARPFLPCSGGAWDQRDTRGVINHPNLS